MKIAINGSFGTGKTALADNIPGYNKILNTERMIADTLGVNIRKLSKEQKDNFGLLICRTQMRLEERNNNFITDTSLQVISAYNDNMYHTVDLSKYQYDLVIHLEPEFEMQDDGIRHIDNEYQKYIDTKLKEIYIKNNIKVYIVGGTIEERTDKVLQLIEKYEKDNLLINTI